MMFQIIMHIIEAQQFNPQGPLTQEIHKHLACRGLGVALREAQVEPGNCAGRSRAGSNTQMAIQVASGGWRRWTCPEPGGDSCKWYVATEVP